VVCLDRRFQQTAIPTLVRERHKEGPGVRGSREVVSGNFRGQTPGQGRGLPATVVLLAGPEATSSPNSAFFRPTRDSDSDPRLR